MQNQKSKNTAGNNHCSNNPIKYINILAGVPIKQLYANPKSPTYYSNNNQVRAKAEVQFFQRPSAGHNNSFGGRPPYYNNQVCVPSVYSVNRKSASMVNINTNNAKNACTNVIGAKLNKKSKAVHRRDKPADRRGGHQQSLLVNGNHNQNNFYYNKNRNSYSSCTSSDDNSDSSQDSIDQRRTWNGDSTLYSSFYEPGPADNSNIYRPRHHPSTYINQERGCKTVPNSPVEKSPAQLSYVGKCPKKKKVTRQSKTPIPSSSTVYSTITPQRGVLSYSNDSINIGDKYNSRKTNNCINSGFINAAGGAPLSRTKNQMPKFQSGAHQGYGGEPHKKEAPLGSMKLLPIDHASSGRDSRHSQDSGITLCSNHSITTASRTVPNKEESIRKYIQDTNKINKNRVLHTISPQQKVSQITVQRALAAHQQSPSPPLNYSTSQAEASFLGTLFQMFSWGNYEKASTQVYSVNEVGRRGSNTKTDNCRSRQKQEEASSSWIADWRSSLV